MANWLLGQSRLLLAARTSQKTSIALKHRGPKRYLGYTKSQILDGLMGINATIWGLGGVISLPLMFFVAYRLKLYNETLREKQEELKEDLLAEGRYK